MSITTKLIILALLVVTFSCSSGRVVTVKSTDRTGRRLKIDARDNFIIIKNSPNTKIYFVADSVRVDTIK